MKKIIRLVTCVLMLFIHLLLNAQNDSKVITNPSVVRYIIGGYTKSNKIYLITNKDYNTLSIEDKGNINNKRFRRIRHHSLFRRTTT